MRSIGNSEVEIVQSPPDDVDVIADTLVEDRDDFLSFVLFPRARVMRGAAEVDEVDTVRATMASYTAMFTSVVSTRGLPIQASNNLTHQCANQLL